jgi:hypothetical protein
MMDGIDIPMTVSLSDRYGNPPPEGTTVYCSSEAGAIIPSGQTSNAGTVSLTLKTMNPRPYTATTNYLPKGKGYCTVMCWTWGQEAFIDQNFNGMYDFGEPFSDVTEPLLDIDDSSTIVNGESIPAYNPLAKDINTGQSSIFWDLNDNKKYDGYCAPGGFTQCVGTNGSYDNRTGIWDDINVIWTGPSDLDVSPTVFALSCAGAPVVFTVTARDIYDNPLVGGSTINISTSGPGAGLKSFFLR